MTADIDGEPGSCRCAELIRLRCATGAPSICSAAEPVPGRTGHTYASGEVVGMSAELAVCKSALRSLNRLYAGLYHINRTLMRASSVQAALNGICETVVEKGGFRLAWFAIAEEATNHVSVAAACGLAVDYLKAVRIRADLTPEGQGPVGRALRYGEIVICNDIAAAGFMEPWRAEANRFGLRSTAAIPIKLAGSVLGAFTLYSNEPEFFNHEELHLLDEISGTISFGLEKLESDRQRELAVKTLQEAIDDLSHSNAELENFAFVASHDLQEPLRMVISHLQLLKRHCGDKLGPEGHESLGYAVAGGLRAKLLVDDLLRYSRLNGPAKPLRLEAAGALLDRALYNLDGAIRETGAVVIRGPLPTVMAEAGQLVQVFQNLLGNAIKFHGPEPPRIHIWAALDGERWVFSVTDNGIGIEPRYRRRIFDIFQRLHPQSQYPGSGLGLTICARIIERHGGRIWLEPHDGPGSTFRFSIPRREPL